MGIKNKTKTIADILGVRMSGFQFQICQDLAVKKG